MNSSSANKRKALQPVKSMVRLPGTVEPLRIEDMVISTPHCNLYFKRLKYKGCPTLSTGRFGSISPQFRQGVELIDAERDDFIRECFQLLKGCNRYTAYFNFTYLIKYLVWADDTCQAIPSEGYLAWTLISRNMDWCSQQCKLGRLSLAEFTGRKKALSWFLRQTNRNLDAENLPSIKGLKGATTKRAPLDLESELKPTAKALFRAYTTLLDHFKHGTTPSRHPLYDKSLIELEASKKGIAGNGLLALKQGFVNTVNRGHPHRHIIEVAMMLTYMFTGMNTNSLANMRISDTSFREVQSGKYIFDSVKGRAKHQEQDNAIGFSKHAKQFIESWLEVSKKIANGEKHSYLFPYFTSDGRRVSYPQARKKPQQRINKLFGHLGLATITPSKFRKTRSDALYRVTESVYLVAMSNNNSLIVTARTYINGTEKEHENNLSAAISAKFDIAKGKDVITAVSEAKHRHGDILDDYEYQRLRKGKDRSREARTPTGARCNDSRLGAASIIGKSLKRVGIKTDDSEAACTDFLACFECAHHAFVTDVDDIWLMLSFKDTLQQLQQTPAVNSMPERKYIDLFNTVDSVLDGFKEKNATNYCQALEKLKDAPHPLYATVYSLNDLLEIFS